MVCSGVTIFMPAWVADIIMPAHYHPIVWDSLNDNKLMELIK